MEYGGHFSDILDAHVAAALRIPAGESPVLDERPNPAIRFAMWGGGVPLTSVNAHNAWSGVKARGVSPWADGFRTEAARTAQPASRAERAEPQKQDASAFRQSPSSADATRASRCSSVPPRPARVLTATDRAALDALRRFGAKWLTDSFTDEELKAAYRQLAFRLHPDQHPQADAASRLELGRQFSQVHAAYRRLAAR